MRRKLWIVALVALGASSACTALLGDFQVGNGVAGDSGPGDGAAPDATMDGGADSTLPDSSSFPDTLVPDTSPTCGYVGLPCCGSTCSTGSCCAGNCVDTAKDMVNCGACGHDCLDAGCSGSMCTPVILTTLGQIEPGPIAVDNTNVYWGQINGGLSYHDGGVYFCDKAKGGSPTKLIGGMDYPRDLKLDSTTVYVSDSNDGVLDECATGGCSLSPTQKAITGGLSDIDLYSSKLFEIAGGGEPRQTDLDGVSNPIDLGGGSEGAANIVSAGGYVFWTHFNGVRSGRFGTAGAVADFVYQATINPLHLATDGSNVYWGQTTTLDSGVYEDWIWSCAIAPTCASSNLLATGQHFGATFNGLTSDGSDVYWTTSDGTFNHWGVRKCATGGCSSKPTTVAMIATAGGGWIGGVAVDKYFVYFPLEDSGKTTVYRVAK